MSHSNGCTRSPGEQFSLYINPVPSVVVRCNSWIQIPAVLVQLRFPPGSNSALARSIHACSDTREAIEHAINTREEARHSASEAAGDRYAYTGRRKPVEPPRQQVIPDNYHIHYFSQKSTEVLF